MTGADAGYATYEGPTKEGLRIGHINIHSLQNKLDFVKHVISYYDFDIFAISETWFGPGINTYDIAMRGYTTKDLRVDNIEGSGGLLIYVRDSYTVRWELIDKGTLKGSKGYFQYIQIKITHPKIMYFVALYKHPAYLKEPFYNHFRTLAEVENVIICGDFNIKYYSNAKLGKIAEKQGLAQMIEDNTYINNNDSSLLDHIYTKFDVEEIQESGIIRSAISDHDLIYCTLTVDEPLQRRAQDLPADIARMRDETASQKDSVSHFMSAIHADCFLGENVKVTKEIPAGVDRLGEVKRRFIQNLSNFQCNCTTRCRDCHNTTRRCDCTSEQCRDCDCKCRCITCTICTCTCRECTWRTCKRARDVTHITSYHHNPPQQSDILLKEVKCATKDQPLLKSCNDETKAEIERGLRDMFKALLSSEEATETEVEKFVYDTFESLLAQRATVQLLKTEIQESLEEDCLLFACLYKFNGISLDEGLLENFEISEFPKKKLQAFVAQRKSNNAQPAHLQSRKLRELITEINVQSEAKSESSEAVKVDSKSDRQEQQSDDSHSASESSGSSGTASANPVRSFHCRNEIIIVQRVEEGNTAERLGKILLSLNTILSGANIKQLIIFRKKDVGYNDFEYPSLELTNPSKPITFLGTKIINPAFVL